MCYAVPAKIVEVEGEQALVDYGGLRKRVNVYLIEDAAVGDYVLVHAGFAIDRVDEKAAEDILGIFEEYSKAVRGQD